MNIEIKKAMALLSSGHCIINYYFEAEALQDMEYIAVYLSHTGHEDIRNAYLLAIMYPDNENNAAYVLQDPASGPHLFSSIPLLAPLNENTIVLFENAGKIKQCYATIQPLDIERGSVIYGEICKLNLESVTV